MQTPHGSSPNEESIEVFLLSVELKFRPSQCTKNKHVCENPA